VNARNSANPNVVVLAALVLTAAVYWAGLQGGFVFDDFPFVVENAAVHVTTLNPSDWLAAALSFPASHQGRWLTMLSFAANHYLTGLDPFWMKLVNLAIHLCNGVLAFLMLRALFALRRAVERSANANEGDDDLLAALIAGAWLLLPVNLSAVLYVSQRLESLSQLFVLAGLWSYVRARLARYERGGGLPRLCIALIAWTLAGMTAKESAVLLPAYAVAVELALPRWRDAPGRRDRALIVFHALLIGVPLVAGLGWLFNWIRGISTYARSFDVGERLLTEARVVWQYIDWTLLPRARDLSFFHDDISISRGLLDPPTTLISLLGLVALLASALWQRRRRPLYCLGILWFFVGHSLTATVIPLELAFEHRNYFPSLGLLLAVAALLAGRRGERAVRIRLVAGSALIALFAFTTALLAREWSDPLRMLAAEAAGRPASANAQYEYAHMLVLTSGRRGEPALLDRAVEVLRGEVGNPASSILPEELLIEIYAATGHAETADVWRSLIAKLHARVPSVPDISALTGLAECQISKRCPDEAARLLEAFLAALGHPDPSAALLSAYAGFAAAVLHDLAAAEQAARDAVARDPQRLAYRTDLVQLLIAAGRLEDADKELARLTPLAQSDIQRRNVAALQAQLADARRAPTEPR
jgi:MYXO-CTERM domain-containing protein